MAKNGDKRAHTVYSISKDFTATITTILIGNNVVDTLVTSIATGLFAQMLGGAGAAVATGVMTVLILTFGEITPKIVTKAEAESVALFMTKPLSIVVLLLRPISFVVESIEAH